MPRTRQLSRALRLNRSTSFSAAYAPASTSNLSFSQHFAQTASRTETPSNLELTSPVSNLRRSSPSLSTNYGRTSPSSYKLRPSSPSTSSNNSTNSSSYSRVSKDYGYSSGQSGSYQTNLSSQNTSTYQSNLPGQRALVGQSSNFLEVKAACRLGRIQRHSSFNPADYRPKYSSEVTSYKHVGSEEAKGYLPGESNNTPQFTSTLIRPKIYTDTTQLTSTQLHPTSTNLPSERRSFFTKCRRSTSLLSRYKPKSLRFVDESPCILSIYVAEPKTEAYRRGESDRKVVERGILKAPEEKAHFDGYEECGYGENDEEEMDIEDGNDEEMELESLSDESFKAPPVIPRTVPPAKSDSYQNGLSNMKDATFGSTGDSHYKQLYEKTMDENERLRKQLDEVKSQGKQKDQSDSLLSNGSNTFITVRKNFNTNNANSNSSGGSHSPSPTATPSTGNSTHLDETDRRAYERKIAELEYELQKARQLQSDHKRLKDENNALIRVISKLSKDYPRQTANSTVSTPINASSTGAQTKSGVQTAKVVAKENTKQLSFQNN